MTELAGRDDVGDRLSDDLARFVPRDPELLACPCRASPYPPSTFR